MLKRLHPVDRLAIQRKTIAKLQQAVMNLEKEKTGLLTELGNTEDMLREVHSQWKEQKLTINELKEKVTLLAAELVIQKEIVVKPQHKPKPTRKSRTKKVITDGDDS